MAFLPTMKGSLAIFPVVQSLHNLLETFQEARGEESTYVLDKGFYSKKNIDELLERRDQFTISVPLHSNWIQHAIDEVGEDIHGPEGYRVVGDEVLYVHSQLYPWGSSIVDVICTFTIMTSYVQKRWIALIDYSLP